MSAGHHTHTRHHEIEAHEQAQLERLMADPVFVKAVQAYTKEDDQDDVAYLGGSEDDGQTIDFDRHFVAAIEAGQVKLNGKAYDPRPFLHVHESVEGAILRGQFSKGTWTFPMPPSGTPDYTPAHRIAEIAERHAVEHALGPDAWKPYNDSIKPWIKADEHEQIQHPPPHILRQPYEAANQSPNSPDYAKMFGGQQKDDDDMKLKFKSPTKLPSMSFSLPGRHPQQKVGWDGHQYGARMSKQYGARMPQYGARMSKQYGARMPQADGDEDDQVSVGGGVPPTAGASTGKAPAFPARHHSLAMASATHLENMGHITTQKKSQIHNHARAQLAQIKSASAVPYGALSPTPALRQPGTGPDRSFATMPSKQRAPGRGMTSGAPMSPFKQYR